jgi:ABC-type xylose transport system permease subunit
MELAALFLWIGTGMVGLYMLGFTMSRGRDSTGTTQTHIPSFVVFWHATLAATGFAIWIGYMFAREQGWAWAGLVALVLTAVLGAFMMLIWLKDRYGSGAAANRERLAEQQVPSAAVHVHGLLATLTIVAALLTALQIGT